MSDKKIRKGVVVIIENSESKYLLLRHRKNDLWGFISGGLEEGESELEAAVRESKEESGLDLVESKLLDTGEIITFVSSKGPGQQTAFIYTVDSPEIQIDGEEISDHGWFSKEEVLKNLEPKPPLVKLFSKIVG